MVAVLPRPDARAGLARPVDRSGGVRLPDHPGGLCVRLGGTTGTGPGLGISGRIPFEETDFIFAIIGEELGLAGSTAVLCAFLLMAGTGLRIAQRSTDEFLSLLAVGLTTLIAVQAFIIIAGVTRVLPLTGITLPFVSYGGSSLLANYVLWRCSSASPMPPPSAPRNRWWRREGWATGGGAVRAGQPVVAP
ncbi:MAG: FtsW/RodA/SpoVE family cell cycle protein [Microthrixaceae bacterium]